MAGELRTDVDGIIRKARQLTENGRAALMLEDAKPGELSVELRSFDPEDREAVRDLIEFVHNDIAALIDAVRLIADRIDGSS